MKKLTVLLLSLALLFICCAVPAEAAEEAPAETKTARYQFRNLTGDAVKSITITDNKTGEVQQLIAEGGFLMADQILYYGFSVDGSESDEDLVHRYTLSFATSSGYTAEFGTLSFEDVLIDLLAPDAVTGATPIRFDARMFQAGKYKIVNNSGKMLKSVTITENANENNNQTAQLMIESGDVCFIDFAIDPDSEASKALTIKFVFDDGTECSFGALSIEEASLIMTPDTITGATPFTFGLIDAE